MELKYIKMLNDMDCETTINYSKHTKQWYVASRAEIINDVCLIGIVYHSDTIEEAINMFNEAIQGKRLLLSGMNKPRIETFII